MSIQVTLNLQPYIDAENWWTKKAVETYQGVQASNVPYALHVLWHVQRTARTTLQIQGVFRK